MWLPSLRQARINRIYERRERYEEKMDIDSVNGQQHPSLVAQHSFKCMERAGNSAESTLEMFGDDGNIKGNIMDLISN